MKDFFDIWKLSRQFDFAAEVMEEAMRLTFKYRKTEMPTEIVAFSSRFIDVKQIQWAAFHKRIKQPDVPISFLEIVREIELFISPIVTAIVSGEKLLANWIAPGPWLKG